MSTHIISKAFKKILLISFGALIILSVICVSLSVRSGYGIWYIPTIYKGLIKDLLFRAYGPKTIPAYKVIELYTKLTAKALLTPQAPYYKEHMLTYDVTFFDQITIFPAYSEIFVKEIYHFSASTDTPFIIDCGSNTGLTLLYFKMLYPKAKIIAFEPSKECFKLMQKNISDNHLTDITVYNKALSDHDGIVSFWDPSQGKGDGRASILMQGNKEHMTEVESVKLSTFITQPVDLLKMDIEGSEFMVFQELALANKLKDIKEIVLEYHHHIPTNNTDRFGAFLALLESNNFGYQIRGCNVGIAYQFDPKEVQLLNIHAYNKAFKK
jgi:FkbM family methyltransferase